MIDAANEINSSKVKCWSGLREVVVVPVPVISPSERVLERRVQLSVEGLESRVQVVHGESAAHLFLVTEENSDEGVDPEGPLADIRSLLVIEVSEETSTQNLDGWVEVGRDVLKVESWNRSWEHGEQEQGTPNGQMKASNTREGSNSLGRSILIGVREVVVGGAG